LTSWKGSRSILYNTLPYPAVGDMKNPWGSYVANKLHGTMGDSFAPLHTYQKGDSVPVFVDDAFLSLSLKNINEETFKVKGVELIRFRLTEETLQNATNNPLNIPYYMNGPNGFWNLSTPKLAPVFPSMPHMLYVDKATQDMVEGQNPNKADHSTWLGVEPYTGMTLTAQKNAQINSIISKVTVIDPDENPIIWFENVTDGIYLPVAWMHYGGTMTDDIANKIKGQVYVGAAARNILLWAGVGIGLFALFIGLCLLLSAMKELRRETSGRNRVVSSGSRPRGYRRVSEG